MSRQPGRVALALSEGMTGCFVFGYIPAYGLIMSICRPYLVNL